MEPTVEEVGIRYLPHRVQVHYRNGSEEPIFAAAVALKSHWGGSPDEISHWLHVVPPHGEGVVELVITLPVFDGDNLPLPPVEMAFTDARGRGWTRTDQGQLEEIVGDRPPLRNVQERGGRTS